MTNRNRRESDMGGEKPDAWVDNEPDYEGIWHDRREQRQHDLEFDPTLNP
jgi:hypothetical protein